MEFIQKSKSKFANLFLKPKLLFCIKLNSINNLGFLKKKKKYESERSNLFIKNSTKLFFCYFWFFFFIFKKLHINFSSFFLQTIKNSENTLNFLKSQKRFKMARNQLSRFKKSFKFFFIFKYSIFCPVLFLLKSIVNFSFFESNFFYLKNISFLLQLNILPRI